MAIRFHYQSDSLTPRRVSVATVSKPFAVPLETPPALVAKTTEVGVIGSTYLNTANLVSGNYRTIRNIGYGNVDSMTSGLSVLVRVIPRVTGFATAAKGGLFLFGGAFGQPYMLMRALTDGRIQLLATNADFATMVNLVSVTTVSFTSGTAVDIVFTWTGSNGANGAKIFVNGVQLVQGTAAGASLYTDAKGQLFETILPCNAWPQGETSIFDTNELVVWNEVIDPTASGLNLVGPSRTSFVTSTPATAVANLPAVGEVKSGVLYGIDNAHTGTRTSPTAAQVKSGVQYGAGGNEFTGNVTLPAAGDVETGVQYGAAGTEFTGTLETGASDPGVDNVLAGVDYEIAGIPLTGTYEPVTEAQVQDGVEFGPNGSLTGSFGRHTPQTNQYFAPLEVQAEIFAVLNGDADLTTLLGANKVFDFVPDKKAFPYVTINALPFVQRDNATNDGMECEFQINVWYSPGATGQTSRGNKPVQLIQKRIDELLQHRSLCVNGWNTLQLRRTFIDILVESDNVTRQGIQRFKLFLGSKD